MTKSYSKLALAIIKTAVDDGDVEFFETDWGYNMIELAKFSVPISMVNLKKMASKNSVKDIFSL